MRLLERFRPPVEHEAEKNPARIGSRMLHRAHARPFASETQQALLHDVFRLAAIADHEVGAAEKPIGVRRREALELRARPPSRQ